MAKASNASPSIFVKEIEDVVKGTAGAIVATRYSSFMQSMLTDAIPLAEQLMTKGELDIKKFEKNIGSETKSSEQDFAFRFGAAMADSFIERIALSPEAIKANDSTDKTAHSKLIQESTDRLCTGLALISPGIMNYTISRAMSRMGSMSRLGALDGVEVKLNQMTCDAMARGFADSTIRGIWPDAQKAENDFVKMVVGTNTGGKPKAATAKKNP